MINEKEFFGEYKVLEIKRNNYYEYYLEKIGYGHLFYMFGSEHECFPEEEYVLQNIKSAEEENFWGD